MASIALRIGAVTDDAGRDLGLRGALLVENAPRLDERAVSVTRRFGGERCEIVRELAGALGSEPRRGAPHILRGKGIVAAMVLEGQELLREVMRRLPGDARCGGEALRR